MDIGIDSGSDSSKDSQTQAEFDAEFDYKKKGGSRRSGKSAAPADADESKVADTEESKVAEKSATISIACGAFEKDGAMWGAKRDGLITVHSKDAKVEIKVPFMVADLVELIQPIIGGPPFNMEPYNFDIDCIYLYTAETGTKGRSVVFKLRAVGDMEVITYAGEQTVVVGKKLTVLVEAGACAKMQRQS